MKKATKIAIFGIPVLVGFYLIYLQLRRKKVAQPGSYTPPPSSMPNVSDSGTNSGSGCKYPLKKNLYNCDKVELLQWALNHIPVTKYKSKSNLVKYRPLVEDGDFGPKTEAVLKDLTASNSVNSQIDMDNILALVVTNPIKFQEEENKYVMASSQNPPKEIKIGGNPF